MIIRISKTKGLALTRIHPLEAHALAAIPDHADPEGVADAQQRLLQKPVRDEDAAGDSAAEALCRDWEEFVAPDLQQIFDNSMDRVREDLASLHVSSGKNVKSSGATEAGDTTPSGKPRKKRGATKKSRTAAARPDKDTDDGEDAESAGDEVYFQLTIPLKNLEDWLRAINQARLVMAEKELWIEDSGRIHGPTLAMIHYELYTSLLECLVQMER
jgi:hypothetical protein